MLALVCVGCESLDKEKATAFLDARESQVAHEISTADVMCRRGTLTAAESAEVLQTQTVDSRTVRAAAISAERALLASNPPERIRTAVADLSRAAAEVQAGSARVLASCSTGSMTTGTGAARRQLEASKGAYRDRAAVFRTMI